MCIGRIILTQTNFPFCRPGVQVGNDLSCSMICSLHFPSSPIKSMSTILPSLFIVQVRRLNSSGLQGFLNFKVFIKYLIKSSFPFPYVGIWSTTVYTESHRLSCPKQLTLQSPRKNIVVQILIMQNCPMKMTCNDCVYAVQGIGGLKNEAKRNVKPDLLPTVSRDRATLFNINFNLTQNSRIA